LKGSPQSKLTAHERFELDFQIQEGKGGSWIWPLCSVNYSRFCALGKRANFFGVVGLWTLNKGSLFKVLLVLTLLKCCCALTYSIGALTLLKLTRSHKKNEIEMQFTCNSCPTANVWRKLIFCNKYLTMFWVQKII
jgi:hypothetical protein